MDFLNLFNIFFLNLLKKLYRVHFLKFGLSTIRFLVFFYSTLKVGESIFVFFIFIIYIFGFLRVFFNFYSF